MYFKKNLKNFRYHLYMNICFQETFYLNTKVRKFCDKALVFFAIEFEGDLKLETSMIAFSKQSETC